MHVEIWSDILCPWCYIGKRRLETALSRFAGRDAVRVTWRSFQLDPSAPRDSDETTRAMLARKYGVSPEQADAMQERVARIAAEEGLEYRLEKSRVENSFDAHRLLHLAHAAGGEELQSALKERLFAANFTEGLRISDHDTLLRLALEAGLDPEEARAVLESDRYADAVRVDRDEASRLGVTGVPFFVFDRKFGVSGAQPADTLLRALEEAASAN